MKKSIAVGLLGLALIGGACSKSKDDNGTVSDASNTTVTTTAPADSSTAPSAKTADANTASASELVAALEANGVPNASRWANEIQEYRPYPTSDPSLQKLKDNLAKYNPGTDVLSKIIASLTV